MILITSAAYISPGLISEFGLLPPCMLPVQNRRLFYHQHQIMKSTDDIFITLPSNFILSELDKIFFQEEGVNIVYVPVGFTLGASIIYALNTIARYNEPLKILHGDTLIEDLPEGLDLFSIAEAEDDYNWSYFEGLEGKFVYAGYFAFSSQSLLIRSITEQGNDFMSGVRAYSRTIYLNYKISHTWLDFGMVNSYYRSKTCKTTQRSFNDLKISKYSVKKYSSDIKKVHAEAEWFNQLPKKLKHFIPSLWDYGIEADGIGFYEIEYFYLSSLADLFVFGRNPLFVWKQILNSCVDFINHTSLFNAPDANKIADQSILLYKEKTKKRLSVYCKTVNIDMNHSWKINSEKVPSLNEIIEEISIELSTPAPKFMHIMHGDLCFSNILYDFKSKSIHVIDPRGLDLEGNYSIYGDIRYDVAKLAHSVIGMYDFIIGGYFTYNSDEKYIVNLKFSFDSKINEIQNYFKTLIFNGYSLQELNTYQILVHLFLSMIPLHADNPHRQDAMLANALRLYLENKRII